MGDDLDAVVYSFDEVLDKISHAGISPALLIGNGFSRAWDDKRFRYDSLLQDAKLTPRTASVFALFGTTDFEAAMRTLVLIESLLESYEKTHALRRQISADVDELRQALLQAVHRHHPEYPSDISKKQYAKCSAFLRHFGKVFTLNYDLLLYWVINDMLHDKKEGCHLQDGFRKPWGQDHVLWKAESAGAQSVYYLHGALHIVNVDPHPRKLSSADSNESIMAQLTAMLEQGSIPLMVADGIGARKLETILERPYLRYCYNALKDNISPLVLYGVALSDADQHITSAIVDSNTSDCYVGLRRGAGPARWGQIRERCLAMERARGTRHKTDALIPQLAFTYFFADGTEAWG